MTVPGLRKAYEATSGANDGDAADRILTVETRFGTDLTTGTLWPTANQPTNASRSYAWYCDNLEDVPFSERYQFLGDPRHCPYADLSRIGVSFPNGYNWFFDNFNNGTNVAASWPAFDAARMNDAWLGDRGSALDVGRLMYWLRSAITKTEAVYTTLTGFSYYYLSVGGDVGYDSANGFANSIPMDGTPFGQGADVFENSIIDGVGTACDPRQPEVRAQQQRHGGQRHPRRRDLVEQALDRRALPGRRLRRAVGHVGQPARRHRHQRAAVPADDARLGPHGPAAARHDAGERLRRVSRPRAAPRSSTSARSRDTFHHDFKDGRTAPSWRTARSWARTTTSPSPRRR